MDENGNFPQKSGKTIKTKAKKKKRKEKMKSWRKERKDFGSFGRISQKHLKQQELRRDAEGLQEDMTGRQNKDEPDGFGNSARKVLIFFITIVKCKQLSRPN